VAGLWKIGWALGPCHGKAVDGGQSLDPQIVLIVHNRGRGGKNSSLLSERNMGKGGGERSKDYSVGLPCIIKKRM